MSLTVVLNERAKVKDALHQIIVGRSPGGRVDSRPGLKIRLILGKVQQIGEIETRALVVIREVVEVRLVVQVDAHPDVMAPANPGKRVVPVEIILGPGQASPDAEPGYSGRIRGRQIRRVIDKISGGS